jgi:hypothetical protein
MNCQYCTKEYTSKIGFSNHVRRCPSNPNRVMETLTQEGRQKLIQNRVDMNNKQWNDPAFKEKHRAAMKKAVLANPESYSSSNRGRTKQIIVDGIKLQGQWEVDFYLWAKANGLEPKRPDQAFKYEWNGERWYHPDFYIESLDLYVEVKGYETDRDRAKWLHFPGKLRIIKEAEIKQIRKGCFVRL